MKCYIFDIDGTLADCQHRIHHIQRTDDQPKDWDAYYESCDLDKPIEHMVSLARNLTGYAPIVLVSGRRESTRQKTINWLLDQHIYGAALHLRQDNDHRDDDIIKIEILEKIRAEGFEPIMAFDDRTRVVKAWRAAGIPCAQVAEGDF